MKAVWPTAFEGYSEEDHEKAIADRLAAGTAHNRDLFVCIRDLRRAIIPGRSRRSVGKGF